MVRERHSNPVPHLWLETGEDLAQLELHAASCGLPRCSPCQGLAVTRSCHDGVMTATRDVVCACDVARTRGTLRGRDAAHARGASCRAPVLRHAPVARRVPTASRACASRLVSVVCCNALACGLFEPCPSYSTCTRCLAWYSRPGC